MSLVSETAPTTERIQSALKRYRGSLDKNNRALFKAFVTETLRRLRGPFLAHHGSREVLQRLELAFEHARTRPAGGVNAVVVAGREKGVVAVINLDDQPFVVDTARLFLSRAGADFRSGFNLAFSATRDEHGVLVAVGEDGGRPESLVLLEAEEGDLGDDLAASSQALRENLNLARVMVRDFRGMVRTVERWVERLEGIADHDPLRSEAARETASFLKWLGRENFVFMGMETADGDALGIQSLPGRHAGSPDGEWPTPHDPGTVRVRKSLVESRIHRAGRIDEVLVRLPGSDDEPQFLFVRGMFTYRAVTQPCRQVPILRRVLARILTLQSIAPGSFRYKGIANVFDSLPTEFLFTVPISDIVNTVEIVFDSEQRHEVDSTFLMTGPYSAFCLTAMPKAAYSDELRRELEVHTVNSLRATYSDHGLYMGRFETVLLYFYLTGVHDPGPEGRIALASELRALATPWTERLWSALAVAFDDATADLLTETYGRAFPESWIRHTSVERAVRDITLLQSLSGKRAIAADMYDDHGVVTLRLYQHADLHLTRILPVLDAFGLDVIDSYATTVRSRGGTLYLDTFRIHGATGASSEQLRANAAALVDAIEAVFRGHLASDSLNQLVLSSGLAWRQVDVLRAYLRYGRQLDVRLSEQRTNGIVNTHPVTTGRALALFAARFDPDLKGSRKRAIAKAERALDDELRLIRTHDEDLLFRSLANAIRATVRTNAYRDDRKGHYVSFKFDCALIEHMPSPRPIYEIFVSSTEVEGVHLRFGKIARGGLRWSDRDDYRTEVLGLATTQVVKNVLIVPTGCKGGFKLKHASAERSVVRAQADEQYKTFIRGLLDVTDNAVGGEIVPPPRVVRHDPDDAYFVVAADKGTAHLSDTANKLSAAYGFWLDDAFASGGSNGYDHKKVGITARGAWVLVRRSFSELGIDPDTTPFTAVGIGDMGGDVFGNGLIETPQVRLRAAFNHRHVFLDPNPDEARTFVERKRLFAAGPAGGWDQYDEALLSEGGGIFERSAKSIPLSPQVQEMLGLSVPDAAPEEVIRHILRMETDLLWNGGIGTYVKASWETHIEAGDRANDDVRVDACDLRCRIIGEGGNLGFTQEARIEAAQGGALLNADFVDNSGGVDMSDHEVNLKILLSSLVSAGTLSLDERNALLEQMTLEVADLVLAGNDQNGRQISRDLIRSRENIFEFGRAIAFITRHFDKSREELHLPDDAELAARSERGEGLTRPEVAVLSAWAKMYVYQELLQGKPRELPGYDALLLGYFPKPIQERYADEVRAHMLADEIAMTVATNRMVADAGAAFFPMTAEKTGRPVSEAARSYIVAQSLAGAPLVTAKLDALKGGVSLERLNQAWIRMDSGVRQVSTYWLGARERVPSDHEIADMLGAVDRIWDLQAQAVLARNQELVAELGSQDIPADVAVPVLKAEYLNAAIMVWAEAKRAQVSFECAAVAQLAVGQASGLQAVLDDLTTRVAGGRWDPLALHILHNRFNRLLRDLLTTIPIEVDGLLTVDDLAPQLAAGAMRVVNGQVEALVGGGQGATVASLLVLEERVAGEVARMRSDASR